jgi:hypothetical protein
MRVYRYFLLITPGKQVKVIALIIICLFFYFFINKDFLDFESDFFKGEY